jgi:hypothetical protein
MAQNSEDLKKLAKNKEKVGTLSELLIDEIGEKLEDSDSDN